MRRQIIKSTYQFQIYLPNINDIIWKNICTQKYELFPPYCLFCASLVSSRTLLHLCSRIYNESFQLSISFTDLMQIQLFIFNFYNNILNKGLVLSDVKWNKFQETFPVVRWQTKLKIKMDCAIENIVCSWNSASPAAMW